MKIICFILFIFFSGFHINSFSQNEIPFFQFGLTGGLNASKINREDYAIKKDSLGIITSKQKLAVKNVALPHFGVNSILNFKNNFNLRAGLQYSFRGCNIEKPLKKYRINYFDIYALPGYTFLPGLRFEAGLQYSILYAQFYKILNGSFESGEEKVKITDYKSRPELILGFDLRLQKNLSIYARYSIPTKSLESSNLQFGISLIINDNLGGNSDKTAYTLDELFANPLGFTKLIIHRKNLVELPPEIGKCFNLEEIKLNGNNLKTLPKEIGNLVNLKLLEVSFNEIEYLPNEIGNLSKLEFLRIDNNKLRQLPPQIGMLENLCFFTIGKNYLIYYPEEIGNLINLVELDLSNSGPLELPISIVNLKRLENLYINGYLMISPSSINPRLNVNGPR